MSIDIVVQQLALLNIDALNIDAVKGTDETILTT